MEYQKVRDEFLKIIEFRHGMELKLADQSLIRGRIRPDVKELMS